MKKIIAISVMFALIAGAVFADTSIGGAVETRFSLASQMGDDGDDPTMGGYVAAAQFTFSGSNADGTLGGQWRYRNTNEGKDDIIDFFDQAFVWWKPVEQVKIFLGIDQDGLFDTCDFVGWAFHAGDNDYLFNHNWDFWRQIFPGNWDGFGLAFSFYPMPGLDINLALASGKVSWRQAPRKSVENIVPISDPDSDNKNMGMLPGRLRFTANYSLDFGKISLVYIGGGSAKEKGGAYMIPGNITGDNNGLFGLSALITAIEGIQIKVGGSVVLNGEDSGYSVPMLINAGLGVAWAGEGFGVKFRAGLVMQQEPSKGADDIMFITANVMPYFAVGEKGQVLVDIGVTNDSTQADDFKLGWYVTPAYRFNMEGGAFKIGIQLFNNIKVNDLGNSDGLSYKLGSAGNVGIGGYDFVRWNIPMLLSFNF